MASLDGEKSCFQKHQNFSFLENELFCNATWDLVLCWPPTRAAENATLNCPDVKGVDTSKLVYKHCLENGQWEGKISGLPGAPQGWTNYTPCFTPEIRMLMNQLNSISEEDAQIKLSIASGTRILEFVGLTTSLVTLLVSLFIFSYFRSLKNNRTKIHQNLFVAMLIQVIIRLTVYIDQAISRGHIRQAESSDRFGIDNTPILCEASYILIEYSRTAMFMWLFIEGLYLHNRITVTVFQHKFYYSIYRLAGWGIPIPMTASWASVTAVYYKARCWWGYSFTPYYWILEGPRLAVITMNLFFLLNIIRVLVTKLRESNSREAVQVRKAVKAAIVLLPLLGITTMLRMIIISPLDKSLLEFGLWAYASHFLTSFQGFFVALLYCFINGEVRAAISKFIRNYFLNRTAGVRRDSAMSSVFLSNFHDDGLPSRARSLCACLFDKDREPRVRWPL